MARAGTKEQRAVDPAAIEALVRGDHSDPFSLLGVHDAADGTPLVRTFQPHAGRVWRREPAEAFFVARLPNREADRLRPEVGGSLFEIADPSRFPPILGELD